jgi:hypothetical protein
MGDADTNIGLPEIRLKTSFAPKWEIENVIVAVKGGRKA